MRRKTKRVTHARPGGFTLVELLVVIVIIAILAAFLVVGVMTAMNRAQRGRIQAELMGLVGGIEQYKLLHGEYPPSEPDEFQAHLERLFPRTEDAFGSNGIPQAEQLTEDELLYMWLSGYSDDPKHPLTGSGERRPLFDFDLARLKDPNYTDPTNPGGYNGTKYNNRYFPKSSEKPYLYFRKRRNDPNWGAARVSSNYNHEGVRPVLRQTLSDDFQIISSGLEPDYNEQTDITSFEDGTEKK